MKTKVVLYTYQTTKNKGKKFGVICTLSTYLTNLTLIYNYKKKSGTGITLFNNPHKILERLELLGASILAGNNGVIPEFSKLVHLLKQMKVISNKQLNDLLKTYITIR